MAGRIFVGPKWAMIPHFVRIGWRQVERSLCRTISKSMGGLCDWKGFSQCLEGSVPVCAIYFEYMMHCGHSSLILWWLIAIQWLFAKDIRRKTVPVHSVDIVMLKTSGSTQNSGLNHDSLSGVAGCRWNPVSEKLIYFNLVKSSWTCLRCFMTSKQFNNNTYTYVYFVFH